ncbi:tetratricopeptide repeat protein [Amycolatopsis sp. NPDC051128]|uniref:tetratricopeptide repeat protein n=1 Tax=Amycolatopsis sp. NPDC051128 TaxID=3155412 RepID=UPI00344867A4
MSVVIAAGVGVVTDLATGEFSWALTVALVVLVAVQVGLSVWQAGRERQDLRDARDAMLGPLRSPAPIFSTDQTATGQGDGVSGARGVVHWLTAPFSPTPLWGRSAVHDRLVAWCEHRDPRAEVARVVVGSAGVGKSRLALAVAEFLLGKDWAAGRLQGDGAGLVERIVAADDPTLVIVDDADRVSVSVLEALLGGAIRHPDLVRVVLLARTAAAVPVLSDTVLPHLRRIETLEPVGEAGDRQRWYGEAVRAYARALQVSPPDLSDRPVGSDDDTPLVLHARALLAVLGRINTRTEPPSGLFTELVALEQRGWAADLSRLPVGCDVDTLAEALTVLLLSPAADVEEAATLLRRLPQFAHDSAQESRVAVAGWVHRRYPLGPDHRPDLVPHLIADRLVLDTLSRRPQLLRDQDALTAAPVLARASTTYDDALEQLTILLAHKINQLPEALAIILATGVTGHLLDRALANLISTDVVDDIRACERLLALTPPATFPHLRIAFGQLLVTHRREQVEKEPDQYRPGLAKSLYILGTDLWEVGRYREALDAIGEAVAIRRRLVDIEPEPYLPLLASSLSSLGACLRAARRYREALGGSNEAVAIYRRLADKEPERYRPPFATSLNNLGLNLDDVGRYWEALEASNEAVAIYRRLADKEPDQYRSDLADCLVNLGSRLRAVGRHREAVEITEEAVTIYRRLIDVEPERHRSDLASSLNNLGAYLREAGRYREALQATDESVTIRRRLVDIEPERYRPDLASSLSIHGACLRAMARCREAVKAGDEAVTIFRTVVDIEPERYRPDLANSLNNLGLSLEGVGRYRDALEVVDEAVAIYRRLVDVEPEAYRTALADCLSNFGACMRRVGRYRDALEVVDEAVAIYRRLADKEPEPYRAALADRLKELAIYRRDLDDIEGALVARRESLSMWRACSEKDPQEYEARYRSELASLCQHLARLGRHDEAVALGLEPPDSSAQRTNNA